MTLKQIIFVFFIISRFAYCQVDTTWTYKKDKIVIPFELINNLIILKVNLNGVKIKMILDTGSKNNLLFSIPENDSLNAKESRMTYISGIGMEEPIEAIISSNNKIKIKDYCDNKFEVLILNQNEISFINKFGVEINGILGYSFFKNNIVEINYSKEKIFIYKDINFSKRRKIKKFHKEKINIVDGKPHIEVNSLINLKENKLNLLFDTGLSDGLWLFENEFIKYGKNNIDDILGQGLSGDIFGKRTRIGEINFSEFNFSDILVSFPELIFFENIKIHDDRNGSIGGAIIKRFDIILDYKKEEIFLKKNKFYNDPFHFNMSGIEIIHSGKEIIEEKIELNQYLSNTASSQKMFNGSRTASFRLKYVLKPAYKITKIRKDSPASEVDLKVGDKIISINDKKAYNYTIQKITDLFQSEEGKKIKMEVEREGKIIEVVFYLKKII